MCYRCRHNECKYNSTFNMRKYTHQEKEQVNYFLAEYVFLIEDEIY